MDSTAQERGERVVCAQIGAREHYAVPRALHRAGRLDTLVTDIWIPGTVAGILRHLPKGKRLAQRRSDDIPDDCVISFAARSLLDRAAHHRSKELGADYRRHLAIGESFGRNVVNRVLQPMMRNGRRPSAFFSYSTGAYEPLKALTAASIPTVVGQIDAARVMNRIRVEEAKTWTGWSLDAGQVPVEYFERLEKEWTEATRIVVNSEWCKRALVEQGAVERKIRVIPVAYDAPAAPADREGKSNRILTVLWVGQVILLKGIQYLIEAAKRLEREAVRFVVAGPIGVNPEVIGRAPRNMTFLGAVTREDAQALYVDADVFAFPTLGDGFGVTQLEAMGAGLPVIATRYCGDVVTDGVDGRIIPPRDSAALAGSIMEFVSDADRLTTMSAAAVRKSRCFTIARVGQMWIELLDELASS